MSKKKSKVAKQKQSKAKSLTKKRKQIASQYNVPLHSSSTNSSSNSSSISHVVDTNNGNSRSAFIGNNSSKTPHNSPLNKTVQSRLKGKKIMILEKKKVKLLKVNSKSNNNTNSNSHDKQKIDDETRDFMNEYKSLQERTYQQEQQQLHQTQSRKQKSSSTESNANAFNFAQPTFEVKEHLTTDELIIQTTSQLDQQQLINQNNYNNSNHLSQHNIHFGNTLSHDNQSHHHHHHHHGHNNFNSDPMQTNKDLLQRLATQKREQQRLQMLYGKKDDGKEEQMKQNSFWALQDDDSDSDDDNGVKRNKIKDNTPLFNFAAPSFVVPSDGNNPAGHGIGNTSFHMNPQHHLMGEDDPDL